MINDSKEDESDSGQSMFKTKPKSRGVGRFTDDLLAFVIVVTYFGVWAASHAFPDVPRPPLSDATVMFITQIAIAWLFGRSVYDRVKENERKNA